MKELIKRLEALSGPDRETDHFIADLLGKGPPETWQRKVSTPGTVYMDVGSWISPCGGFMRHSVRYTASVDAAMTLIRGDAEWNLSIVPSYRCCATISSGVGSVEDFCGRGATPAIAICIAALKANIQ